MERENNTYICIIRHAIWVVNNLSSCNVGSMAYVSKHVGILTYSLM